MKGIKSLNELKFHESVIINDGLLLTYCMRVYGGYIYTSVDKSCKIATSTFVKKALTSDDMKFPIFEKHEGFKDV